VNLCYDYVKFGFLPQKKNLGLENFLDESRLGKGKISLFMMTINMKMNHIVGSFYLPEYKVIY